MKNLNKNIFWCKNCLMASTRPRISFNQNGICNACTWAKKKKSINWKKKEQDFLKIIKKLKKTNKSDFDLVVPVSGGKDGSYIIHTLKNKYKLNPLAVTVHSPLRTPIGYQNLENFKKNNFNLLEISLPYETLRKLNRFSFIDHGKPTNGWTVGIYSAVIRTAIKFGINLIMYGEDGEVEYGGTTNQENLYTFSQRFLQKIYLEGKYKKMMKQIINKKDLFWWTFPKEKNLNLNLSHWSSFENWDPYKHYVVAKNFCGYEGKDEKNFGTYTNYAQNDSAWQGLHYYLMYLKFGIGRTTQDVGIDIRRGAMTRSQGLQLVRLYDGEFSHSEIEECREYFQMTNREFYKVIDKFANKKLFKKIKNKWVPKFITK